MELNTVLALKCTNNNVIKYINNTKTELQGEANTSFVLLRTLPKEHT